VGTVSKPTPGRLATTEHGSSPFGRSHGGLARMQWRVSPRRWSRDVPFNEGQPGTDHVSGGLPLAGPFGVRFGDGRLLLLLPEDEQGQEEEHNETDDSHGDRDVEEHDGYNGSGQYSATC
jgi:hypothetical protein